MLPHLPWPLPAVLGHEAAGTVIETGAEVTHLRPGDRVCMEPGIPDPTSRAAKLGIYNVDPAVTFWATPPIHGLDFTIRAPTTPPSMEMRPVATAAEATSI